MLWLVVGLQFVMSLTFSVSTPFMPLLIDQIGAGSRGQVELWSGLVNAVFPLSAAILSPLWGALADRTGRKAMVVRACIAACVFNALSGIAQNVWELFAIRAVAGMFGGFSASTMALVGTQVPENRLGFALGWLATGQLVGGLVGPFLGGALADVLHDYRAVFFWTSGGALIASLACVALVREHNGRLAAPAGRERRSVWENFAGIFAHPAMIPLFIVLLLAQIAARATQPIIPLYVQDLVGNAGWLATAAGAAIAVTGIADVIASPLLGKRSDVIGYRKVLVISLIGAAVFTIPQGISENIWVFLALRFGVGIFVGGMLPSANAWIARLFSREERGRVFGLTSSATFLGQCVGPLFAGLIAARYGFAVTFASVGILMFASCVYVLLGVRPTMNDASAT